MLRPGPFGTGMVQLWIDTREEDELVDIIGVDDVKPGWIPVFHAHDRFGEPAVLVHADHPRIQLMSAFDVVVNNADRKGGHVLHALDGAVYGVDHGICLHTEPKLRTVLWGWAREPLPAEVLESLRRGKTNLDIAVALNISPFTVKNHVQRIFRKIGVRNRTQAAARYGEALRRPHLQADAMHGVGGLSTGASASL